MRSFYRKGKKYLLQKQVLKLCFSTVELETYFSRFLVFAICMLFEKDKKVSFLPTLSFLDLLFWRENCYGIYYPHLF